MAMLLWLPICLQRHKSWTEEVGTILRGTTLSFNYHASFIIACSVFQDKKPENDRLELKECIQSWNVFIRLRTFLK